MNKGTICGEYLAKLILKDFFGLNELILSESPDLQDERNGIGIDVTRAYGQEEEHDLSEYLKSAQNENAKPRVKCVLASEEYPKQVQLISDAFKNKIDKRYGFKRTGLFIYSELWFNDRLSEKYNQEVFENLSKINLENNNNIYDCIFICNKDEKSVLYCDFNENAYSVIDVDINRFIPEIEKLKIITGQYKTYIGLPIKRMFNIFGNPDSKNAIDNINEYCWNINGEPYGHEFSTDIIVIVKANEKITDIKVVKKERKNKK